MLEKVKELRNLTGAGVVACKKALEESGEDLEKAVIWLRKNGEAEKEKRSSRAASEGTIGYYCHTGGKICTMVEVNCETDFVARSKEFQDFAHELAMHIAAAHPLWISRENVPPEILDRETEVIMARMDSRKPAEVINKIVNGKLDKFFKDNCLLEQMFIKETNVSIQDKFNELSSKVKENLVIKRFARFEVGSE